MTPVTNCTGGHRNDVETEAHFYNMYANAKSMNIYNRKIMYNTMTSSLGVK